VLSIHTGSVWAREWDKDPSGTITVDREVADASVDDCVALLLPGGTVNPDQLRIHPAAVEFVRAFVETGKLVASVCHGPWTLAEADVIRRDLHRRPVHHQPVPVRSARVLRRDRRAARRRARPGLTNAPDGR